MIGAQCKVCDQLVNPLQRCTNGLCRSCHRRYCSGRPNGPHPVNIQKAREYHHNIAPKLEGK